MEKKLDMAQVRTKLGITQARLAELLDVDRKYVSMIETGTKPLSSKLSKKLDSLLSNPPPASVETITGADPPYFLAHTARERAAQYAVNAFDSAQASGKAGQFETLMLHIAGVVSPDDSYDWHSRQITHIIETHFKGKDQT